MPGARWREGRWSRGRRIPSNYKGKPITSANIIIKVASAGIIRYNGSEETEMGVSMQTTIFYVKIKDDLEKAFKDFFPHMSSNYLKMAKLFKKDKLYPVLAVEKVTIFNKDGGETESSRFLVPSENKNFLWIQSELFMYVDLNPSADAIKNQ
jgi:hypothetical protein